MSFWRRLMGKGPEAGGTAVTGPTQKYLKRYQNFIAIMAEEEAARGILETLRLQRMESQGGEFSQVHRQSLELLRHLGQALELLQEFCRKKPENLLKAYDELASRINDLLTQDEFTAAPVNPQVFWDRLGPLFFSAKTDVAGVEATKENNFSSLEEVLGGIIEQRLQGMFCLSLKSQVTKKQTASLITGRLVPILVIDVGGGLTNPGGPTVHLEDVASIPYKAFLNGMLSIPWPKARPVDMKGFISVVGVTSTTPRAEDQLQKVSCAILSREYMNFSLCLGYHASTIESYLNKSCPSNYIRFHYEGGAASVERRVRRLRLIQGILTRLGFEVGITGDLLDGRKTGVDEESCLKLLEILGRLEVFTKQMDMVMTDDEVIYGYIEDFMDKHC